MPSEAKEAVKVTQTDRDAAADYMSERDYDWGYCEDVREGRVEHPLPPFFARHREEAVREVVKSLRHDFDAWPDYVAIADIAAAIERDIIQENSDGE